MRTVVEEAKSKATRMRELAGKLGICVDPVDLVGLCEALPVELRYKELKPEYYGYIDKPKDGHAVIVVNKLKSKEEQRFTIAHEIGHYVERIAAEDDEYTFISNKDKRRLSKFHKVQGEYDIHEFFADEFALGLILPADQLKDYMRKKPAVTKIAKRFNCSAEIVIRRIMGLIADGSIS